MNRLDKIVVVMVLVLSVILLTPTAKADPLIDIQTLVKSLAQGSPEEVVTLKTPLVFDGESQEEWTTIGDKLDNSSTKHFVLDISGIGGIVFFGQMFIADVVTAQAQGKTIDMHVHGSVYSMHSLVTCFANNLTLAGGASLMFHKPFVDVPIFFGLFTSRSTETNPGDKVTEDYMFDKCVQTGRLSRQEVNEINNGAEVYKYYKDGILETAVTYPNSGLENTALGILDVIIAIGLVLVIIGIIKRI